jgi:GTP-binding protein HflX
VGFIRHLPHDLIEAFRSTLEESLHADLLLHVVDGSDPDPFGQVDAVHEVLSEIGAQKLPEQLVVNKTDQAEPGELIALRGKFPGAVFVSALTGEGIEDLQDVIEARLPRPNVEVDVLVPYSRGDLIDRIHGKGELISLEHQEHGTRVHALVDAALAAQLGRIDAQGI